MTPTALGWTSVLSLTAVGDKRNSVVMNRMHPWLTWALWGVVVALVAVIALGLVANVL
jgi:FtsH-binding integral membrane protein